MTICFHSTRLAPSPTGALHLGHARTFLIAWWMARQAGAKIWMRMEDLDAGRAKPESVQQAYDDLRWLGMTWDRYEEPQQGAAVRRGEVVQSERLGVYRGALEALWSRGAIYPCTCTRAEIAASVAGSASAPHESDGNVRYPGTCAAHAEECAAEASIEAVESAVRRRTGKNLCWRLRVPPGTIEFPDLLAGVQRFDVHEQVGDFPLTRFDGTPAYQLACVADDHDMGIDLVVRGDDLLSSTPRQMLVYGALGWQPPRFAHVPLVVGTDGKRLAKRHGESRIAQFRAAGASAERIVGWVAWRSGQLPEPREISPAEVLARFDAGRISQERVVLTGSDQEWLS